MLNRFANKDKSSTYLPLSSSSFSKIYRIGRKISITKVLLSENMLLVNAQSHNIKSHCPVCGHISHKVHSIYTRRLQDMPCAGIPVNLNIELRKFFCNNSQCDRLIFAEPISGIKHYSRRTGRVEDMLVKMGAEVSSSKCSYLSSIVGVPVSTSTALRMISKATLPDISEVSIIGIDDWAYRKGAIYGSIIVDMEKGKVIDVLCDRECDSMMKWLKKHQKVTLVSRDRATNYSSAIALSGRNIDEVADRFHLIKNMSDCVDRIICRNYKKIAIQGDSSNITASGHQQEIFNAIKDLQSKQMSISKIANEIGVARQTVRKYIAYDAIPPRASFPRNNYFQYEDYVFAEQLKGKSLRKIYYEIKEMGFSGSSTPFYDYIKKRKNTYGKSVTLPPLKISSSLCGTRLFCLSKEEKHTMRILLASNKWLRELKQCARMFHDIIMGKDSDALDDWMKQAKAIGIKHLNSFVYGVERDIAAIKNAIIYHWSNGIVEGHVNRLKNIKRQMYGRAGLELLKRKVVLARSG